MAVDMFEIDIDSSAGDSDVEQMRLSPYAVANSRSSINEFTDINPADLDSHDILSLNYWAACGLPGTEQSNLDDWLRNRDSWAEFARFEICRHIYQFDSQSSDELTPGTYGNSLARFFCWHLLQALCECGIRYHPDRKASPDSSLPADVFAHGIMDDGGKGGTCASLPVVFVSLGRRLGLPLYLVTTRGHAFFRWDDPRGTPIRWENPSLTLWIPPDRFNVNGAGEGISYYDDAFYRQWPVVWQENDPRDSRHLQSMTRREELASFLIERGECFWTLGQHQEALKSYFYARQLIPDNPRYDYIHDLRSRQFLEQEAAVCAIDDQIEDRRRIPGADGHSPHCECGECCRIRAPQPGFPEHGPDCQCFHCRNTRTAAAKARTAGHTSSCRCARCLNQLRQARKSERAIHPHPGT